MPVGMFIDPEAVQKALAPAGNVAIPRLEVKAGPNAPHVDDEDDEMPALGLFDWRKWLPQHYTDGLDELWAEYDDVEERTAERLQALLEEVTDEALRIHLLSVELFERMPNFKLPAAERERFRKEFLAYGKRLNSYRETLASLDPKSTATDSVYVGLVQTRQGAGIVPDAIMHLYFASQLGILDDHAEDMSRGFVGRSLTALDKLRSSTIDAADAVADRTERAADNLLEPLKKVGWVIVGVLAAGVVGVVTVLALRRPATKSSQEAS